MTFLDWAQDAVEQPPPFPPMYGHWTDELRLLRDRELPAIVTEQAQRHAIIRDVYLAQLFASQRCCYTARVRQFIIDPMAPANSGAGARWPFLIAGYRPGLVIYDGHSRLTAAFLRGCITARCLILHSVDPSC